jgi:hypothetical protein
LGLGLLGLGAGNAQETTAHKPLKIMMKSAWGSDDPTKAAFPFYMGMRLPKPGMKYKSSSWAKPFPLCESAQWSSQRRLRASTEMKWGPAAEKPMAGEQKPEKVSLSLD